MMIYDGPDFQGKRLLVTQDERNRITIRVDGDLVEDAIEEQEGILCLGALLTGQFGPRSYEKAVKLQKLAQQKN